jgi:hypothetical protein
MTCSGVSVGAAWGATASAGACLLALEAALEIAFFCAKTSVLGATTRHSKAVRQRNCLMVVDDCCEKFGMSIEI